jgi:hypothetical protein
VPLQCSMPLFVFDTDDFPLADEMHVQQSLACGMGIIRHYYSADSSLELPSVCIYCGIHHDHALKRVMGVCIMANHKHQLIHNITSANGLRVKITGPFIEIVKYIR